MLKKIGTLIFVAAFLLVLVRPLSVSAETGPDIWVDAFPGMLDLTEMQYYYENLSPGQRDICCYLVGLSNYMYLDARGFKFSDDALGSQNAFIAKMIALGSRVLYMDSGLSGASRFNVFLQNYVSAAINYAFSQDTDVDFYDWYDNLDENFVLPYSAELLDAWNVWYADNSIEGIRTYGDVVSPWYSGDEYTYKFSEIPFVDQSARNRYNDFILSYSPVLFSSLFNSDTGQICVSLREGYVNGNLITYQPPNSLVLQRGGTDSYQFARFVNVNNGSVSILPNAVITTLELIYQGSKIYNSITWNTRLRYDVINYGSLTSGSVLIDYCFRLTPFSDTRNPRFWYPYIEHVYLADDLTTFANLEEVFNVEDLNVTDGEPTITKPINKYWWVFKHIDDTFPYPENPVIDNLIDDNGDPVTDPRLTTSIVNNSTVNNYYITNGEPITVPVNWFSRAENYVSYLWAMTEPLVLYARDLLDCMTFFDDGILSNVKGPGPAIFGICVVGVAGGIVSKLLL